MKIAKEGFPFVALFAIATAVVFGGLWWLAPAWSWVGGSIGAVLTAWCVWFFRDPERTTPQEPGAVICPADGVVCSIGRAEAPRELGLPDRGPFERVCIFMNVFNVHVNRVPCDGVIEKTAYTHGKFFNASFDKASDQNERMAVAMKTRAGDTVVFVQIAGLIARRIVCRLKGGQTVRAGDRFGLIRFGSRVDVYMPAESRVAVTMGQKTVAGQTVLAHIAVPAAAPPREVALGR